MHNKKKPKKDTKILLEELGIDIQEGNLEELEPKILENLMNQIIESILTQNINIYEFYEQILTEVDQIKIELKDIKKQLKTVIPNVDNMQKKGRLLQNELAEASKRFHEGKQEDLYLRIREEKEYLKTERDKEDRLRHRRDELEMKLKRFHSMEIMAKGMVTAIGSVATFLRNTSAYLTANLINMKDELDVNVKIIHAHEAERHRISRELHDTVAQDLASLLFEVSICQRAVEKEMKEDAISGLGKIREGIQGGIKGVRQAIFDMRPMAIDDLGLVEAIMELARTVAERYSIKVTSDLIGDSEFVRGILPSYKEMAVYRIVQETFNNIARHSEAKRANMVIAITKQNLTISIKDDGLGFDAKEALGEEDAGSKHYGLLGMVERAKQIGGELTINSEPGKGTTTRVRINLS